MQAPSGTMTTAAAVLVCSGLVLSGQTRPEQTPAFRSGIELVTIDVGVVDRQGNPVRGLASGDFVVTVGGQPRRVVTAEFVDVAAARPSLASNLDMVPISTNEGAGIGRLFVFIVDQSTLELGSARQVTRASSRFFSHLTFADRSALMLLPVGQGVGFTWAHDRVRDALQRVSGMSNPTLASWEYGSLTEARDIANSNMAALRNIGQRECRASISASGGGFGSGGPAAGGPGGGSGQGPAPQPGGGGPPSGGESGGSGTPPQGGQPSGGSRAPREAPSTGGGAFGMDSCTRNIQMQAEAAWRMTQMTSLASLAALRQTLAALGRVRGDKTVILISGGWPMDEREETSLMSTVAAEAAAARDAGRDDGRWNLPCRGQRGRRVRAAGTGAGWVLPDWRREAPE
jgi:VWFA-related protein